MPVSITELEAVAALGWRAPEEARLGQWLLRAAEGFTGRANSALAAGDPGSSLADAVAKVGAWYAARGLPAMIAVPYPLGRPGEGPVDRFLDQQGWSTRADFLRADAQAALQHVNEPLRVRSARRFAQAPAGFELRGVLREPRAGCGTHVHDRRGFVHPRQRSPHERVRRQKHVIALVRATRVSQVLHRLVPETAGPRRSRRPHRPPSPLLLDDG